MTEFQPLAEQQRALRLATAAVRRVPLIPSVTTRAQASLPLTAQTGLAFHVGGHQAATPKPGSDGTAALSALRQLHDSYVVPAGDAVVPYITPSEVALAKQHAAGGCIACRAFLAGAARSARGAAHNERRRAAQQRATILSSRCGYVRTVL
jgi:hypothetical protein